jgi:hypothetical protein
MVQSHMTIGETTMAKDTNAVWSEIDVASLTGEQSAAYEALKVAQRKAGELRTAFETLMNEDAPEGKKLVFGYRFGKLSAAIVDDDRKPSKASPAKQSLSEFLASQRAAGART